MTAIYCRAHHDSGDTLCPRCRQLVEYAHMRLDRCRYGNSKSTCRRCPTHCYAPAMREQIRAVMRYAGPRMLWHYPLAALRHMLSP